MILFNTICRVKFEIVNVLEDGIVELLETGLRARSSHFLSLLVTRLDCTRS